MKLTCPICKVATTYEENPSRPFCSDRCRLIDLGKWILEDYSINETERTGPAGPAGHAGDIGPATEETG